MLDIVRNATRLLVATVAVAGLALTSCGDDDSASDTTATTDSPTTTSTTTTESPDGEQAAAFEIFLLPSETGDDCSEVVGVPRAATVEGDVGDALAQLLAGPTADELAQGLTSWFTVETEGMLNGVVVEGGRAEVDFQSFAELMPNASTSCGSASLLAQLDHTVLQFEGIDEVVYAFDGDREAFYGWLQLSAPES